MYNESVIETKRIKYEHKTTQVRERVYVYRKCDSKIEKPHKDRTQKDLLSRSYLITTGIFVSLNFEDKNALREMSLPKSFDRWGIRFSTKRFI